MTRPRLSLHGLVLIATALSVPGPDLNAKAAPLELISNGGFESGSLSSWTVVDQPGGSGSFFINDASGATPFSGMPTVGPASGAFYGVSDQRAPGAHALIQKFTLPTTSMNQAILSWKMFVNDWSGSGPIVNPAGLDFTASPNQHGRVDLISATAADADPLTTGVGVLANFYLSVDAAASNPNSYTNYSFNILPYISQGGTYAVRFAEVDTQGFLNLGVDDVSVNVDQVPGPVPAFGAAYALGLSRRLKRRLAQRRPQATR